MARAVALSTLSAASASQVVGAAALRGPHSTWPSRAAAERFLSAAVERIGGIRVVVKRPGVLVRSRPAEDVPAAHRERSPSVNATAVFAVRQAGGRGMLADGGGGSITNLTSLAELVALARQAAYTVSKGPLGALTRAVAIDWARYDIRIDTIAQRTVETPMTAAFYSDPGGQKKLERRIPVGRLGRLIDFTAAALFLSSRAAFIAGHIIVDGGGWLCREPALALD